MVNYSGTGPALDLTFGALSDPTRRAILARLALGDASVTELAEPFAVSLPAISKHLRVLESAGLLRREVTGRVHRCRLAPEPMKDAAAWIDDYRAFWERQLNALAKFLETTAPRGPGEKEFQTKAHEKESEIWQHPNPKQSPNHGSEPSKSGGRSPRRGKRSSQPGPTRNS